MWSAQPTATSGNHILGVGVFLSGYAVLVMVMGAWGRLLARRVDSSNLQASLARFNWVMWLARLLVAVWFATGLYGGLGWGEFVARILRAPELPLMLPQALLATAPAFLAW